MLNILIVEDDPSHIRDAQAELANFKNLNGVFATTAKDAIEKLENASVDAMICDTFFPSIENTPPHESGLLVGAYAQGKGIPFVFNSAGHHDGTRFEKFRELHYALQKPGLSSGKLIEMHPAVRNDDAPWKQWSSAIEYVTLIQAKPINATKITRMLNILPEGDYGELYEKLLRFKSPHISIESLCWDSFNPCWIRDAQLEWIAENPNDQEYSFSKGFPDSTCSPKNEQERYIQQLYHMHKQKYIAARKEGQDILNRYR